MPATTLPVVRVRSGSRSARRRQPPGALLVDRRQAWRDFYARGLLHALNGDPARLAAVTTQAEQRLQRLVVPRQGVLDRWRCTVDLCGRARQVLEHAGAVDDQRTRQRLLAGIRHETTVAVFGENSAVAEQSAEQLLEELGHIDGDDQDYGDG